MKFKKIRYLALILTLVFTITSCNLSISLGNDDSSSTIANMNGPDDSYTVDIPQNPGDYEVMFVCNNGYTFYSKSTDKNLIIKPDNPSKLCATFLYWCSDIECEKEFDFSKTISKDTKLYAKYSIDFPSLTNIISKDLMKANIRVECEYYNNTFMGTTTSGTIGSGVIISEDDNYYYCLTNNHVVYKPSNFRYAKYRIEDCFENEYDGKVLYNDNTYDLAIIRFEKSDEELLVANLANSKHLPNKNEYVIAIGNPLGQYNCITYGKVISSIADFNPDEETKEQSYVEFDVIKHSTYIDSGSSGGPLFDTDLNLIGINFASAVNENNDEFLYSYSIPINKIFEFLSNNNFNI